MKKILISAIIVLCLSLTAYSATHTIRFVWDKNTEPDLGGYKLYRRKASTLYTDPNSLVVIINDPNADTILIQNFEATEKTFFVLTAFDTAGNESDYSNEVFMDVDMIPPSIPTGFGIEYYLRLD